MIHVLDRKERSPCGWLDDQATVTQFRKESPNISNVLRNLCNFDECIRSQPPEEVTTSLEHPSLAAFDIDFDEGGFNPAAPAVRVQGDHLDPGRGGRFPPIDALPVQAAVPTAGGDVELHPGTILIANRALLDGHVRKPVELADSLDVSDTLCLGLEAGAVVPVRCEGIGVRAVVRADVEKGARPEGTEIELIKPTDQAIATPPPDAGIAPRPGEIGRDGDLELSAGEAALPVERARRFRATEEPIEQIAVARSEPFE